MANKSLDGLDQLVINTIDKVLRRDANFDLFYYFVENFKSIPNIMALQTQSKIHPHEFWALLSKAFRDNIVALQEFREVDCRHYLKTGQLNFKIDPDRAYQSSVEFTYNFYVGEGRELADMFLELQKIILLQMLAMFRIQYSSKKAEKHKLAAFMEFIQDRGVMILERELVAVYKYFEDRASVPLFSKVNMGGNQANLLKKMNNLAWDMTAARFLERILLLQQGDFTIPMFVSSDKALLEYFKLFPVKATVVHRPTQNVISIPRTTTEEYFIRKGCGDIIKPYLSPESKKERISGFKISTDMLSERISAEYEALLSVLSKINNK